MQIGSLFASNSGTPGFSTPRSANAPPISSPGAGGTPKGGGPPTSTSDTFREVLSRYDVKSITPREYSALLGELRSEGVIDDEQLRLLSLVRLELDGANIPSDEPIDLVEFFSDRIQERTDELDRLNKRAARNGIKPADNSAALAPSRETLEWLEKFARVSAGADAGSIDVAI